MSARLAAISVDLDEVACYTQIHGLRPPAGASAQAIYRKALPRFAQLFEQLRIPATFFIIGRDLVVSENAETIARLHEKGFEMANHTANHLYDFTRRNPAVIRGEIEEASNAIANITGAAPAGFRAPGYLMTDEVFNILSDFGFQYDSSVFSCPPYYLAKTVALAAIRIRGRRSHSIMDTPAVLAAPADPYRVGAPFWRRGEGMLELPVGVARWPFFRLPYIGTFVVLYGEGVARLLTRSVIGRPLVNLELHGIDLADADGDGLTFLKKHRPDLRRSLPDRQAALLSAIETLREAGYSFVTLQQAAERFAG